MRTMAPDLPTWHTDRYTVVEMPDQIDVSNAEDIRQHLLGLLNGDGTRAGPLIADLTGTGFCDSSAVNALLRVQRRAEAEGRRLYAAAPSGGIVRKVFDITAVWRVIPTSDDLGSAIAMAVVAALDEAGSDGADDLDDLDL